MVSQEEVAGFLGVHAVNSYFISKFQLYDLATKLNNSQEFLPVIEGKIAINKSNSTFHSLMTKAINFLPESEIRKIEQKMV